MNLALYIAKRYLLSKKSHRVINIISGVAVAGVTLATMAMICTMSVFNGFKELVAFQFTAFDPQLKIVAAEGKNFYIDNEKIEAVKSLPQIAVATTCFQEKAMVQYDGCQAMVTIKGVEENFSVLTDIEKALIGGDTLLLSDADVHYAVAGAELISTLNCGINHIRPLEIYAPRRDRKINLVNPLVNFKKGHLYSSGTIFVVNQTKYDNNYILTSLDFARDIFERRSNEASSLELKIADGHSVNDVKQKIKAILGDEYLVLDRYEQQEDIFRIMKIEKLISYIFLTFILFIACFNIIGSLSMLIIDKKQDINTLRSLGASNKLITDIFVIEGILISATGAVAGIILGVVACLLQEHFGILALGNGGGNLLVDSYPVAVETQDIILVFVTVILVGVTAVGIPVRMLTRRIFREGIR